jgi:hypothetical protein
VGVDPDDFLGNVPCAGSTGSMRGYVATFVDVTADDIANDELGGQLTLPSTGLLPCTRIGSTAFVVVGRQYKARVAGYDRADLEPQGPGAPNLVDEQGVIIEPR